MDKLTDNIANNEPISDLQLPDLFGWASDLFNLSPTVTVLLVFVIIFFVASMSEGGKKN